MAKYCKVCGTRCLDDAAFCPRCGSPLQNQQTNGDESGNMRLGIISLVLGITGLLAWIIPIFGLPIGVTALVFGISGLKKSGRGMAIAGIVLGIICLVLTIINSAIGAYRGYRGELWSAIEENTTQSVETVYDADESVAAKVLLGEHTCLFIGDDGNERNFNISLVKDKMALELVDEFDSAYIG